jgi:integrase
MFVMHKKADEWPKEIKSGSVTVKIYRTVNRGRAMFTLAYHDGGGRKLRQFADLTEARREAKETADTLNAGRGAALELSGADRDAYLAALRELKPLDVPLNVAIAEYVKAKKFNVPIVEAVKSYAESHNAKLPDKTITEVYQEMLAAKRRDGASEAYLHDLKTRLGAFSRDFKDSIANVTTADLDAWLRRLKLAPRSRNNHRNVIVSLFNFAKSAGYLNRDKSTAAEHTALAKTKGKAISFFSPEDMAKLLSSDDKVIRPMFVLGGFCGLRTAEILRLSWEDIRWAESSIVISEDVSKGGEARRRRIAPLTAPAAAWLADWKDKRGRVLPIDQPEHRVKDVCDATGVKWKKNGLRHSFITYRVAMEKDFVRVAYEAGNSPAMIRSNYDAVATEAEGKLWFSVVPETAKNVIQMKVAA